MSDALEERALWAAFPGEIHASYASVNPARGLVATTADLDLLKFVQIGELGTLRLGGSIEALESVLGVSEFWGPERDTTDPGGYSYVEYTNVCFHFVHGNIERIVISPAHMEGDPASGSHRFLGELECRQAPEAELRELLMRHGVSFERDPEREIASMPEVRFFRVGRCGVQASFEEGRLAELFVAAP